MPATGLLLVTGPFKLNGCPLRRVNQSLVIATKTRLQLNDADLPERLTDDYFRRAKKARRSRDSDDIYQKADTRYQLTEERKEDQKTVDRAVMAAISQHKDGKALKGYLRNLFSLKSGEHPHAMQFWAKRILNLRLFWMSRMSLNKLEKHEWLWFQKYAVAR